MSWWYNTDVLRLYMYATSGQSKTYSWYSYFLAEDFKTQLPKRNCAASKSLLVPFKNFSVVVALWNNRHEVVVEYYFLKENANNPTMIAIISSTHYRHGPTTDLSSLTRAQLAYSYATSTESAAATESSWLMFACDFANRFTVSAHNLFLVLNITARSLPDASTI